MSTIIKSLKDAKGLKFGDSYVIDPGFPDADENGVFDIENLDAALARLNEIQESIETMLVADAAKPAPEKSARQKPAAIKEEAPLVTLKSLAASAKDLTAAEMATALKDLGVTPAKLKKELSVPENRRIAKALGLKNYSKLAETKLCKLITDHLKGTD